MSDLFVKLMEQIEMPLEMRRSSAFSSADISEVKVHSLSRLWEFHFTFAEILPIEVYKELDDRLRTTFAAANIKVTFDIKATVVDYSDHLLQAYYQEAFEHAPCDAASFKSSFAKLTVTYDQDRLLISTPDFVNNDHFKYNHIPNLQQQMHAFGFLDLQIEMVSDLEMTQVLQNHYENNRQLS